MPTTEELLELSNKCYWEWTDSYNGTGKAGYIVYKAKSDSDKGVKKGKGSSTTTAGSYSLADTHVFLPAAGYRADSGLDNAGSDGHYWSSSLNSISSNNAYYLSFDSNEVYRSNSSRCFGQSVRAVCQ